MAQHGGTKAALENAKAVQKQIRILENRLDKALQKFNEAIEANRGLREEIDTLRRERVVFDDIYRKLENELQSKKKEKANIIEQANAAYEARDSAQAQMAALKQQADKEDKMKKKVTASAWGIAKDKATINTHIEKIQSYEEAFAKIQAATGISDVDELVQNFIDGEDQNFTVFNFTTGQNDEIEKLEQQIQEYKTELEQLRSAGGKSEDAQSKQKVMASL